MKKIVKTVLKNFCEKSTQEAFTILNHYQPEIPSAMAKQIEDKKD